jgi:hypothetical protein
MESLALVVGLIVLGIILLGPISVGMSFLKKGTWSRVLTMIFASMAIFSGTWLFFLAVSTGSRMLGVFATSCGIWAIYRRRQS